jgi:hypothetical protein
MKRLLLVLTVLTVTLLTQASFAQGLNWDGQTGALLTPFAYTASSGKGFLGKPEVSYHFLDTGDVIGYDSQFSVTEGIAKRFEIGFTQSASALGSTEANGVVPGQPLHVTPNSAGGLYIEPASRLFSNGYTAIHGKFTVIPENFGKNNWVPAIAVGAIGRFGGQRLSWVLSGDSATMGKTQKNGDVYIVATKTVTQFKKLPFVLNLGEKVTDASVLGIVGNAGNRNGVGDRWQGCLFGAAAFVVKGPAKSLLVVGSEVVQEPKYVQGLNSYVNGTLGTTGVTANIPTSLSYFVRIVPHLEGGPLQVDLAVAQAAGKIVNIPTVAQLDVKARAQFGMGISYHF